VTPTPGTYLKMRRTARGLSVADVAARIATVPRLAEHARVELIEMIEADAAPARFDTIVVLSNIYPLDLEVLSVLVRISLGADLPPPRLCRFCGCSARTACLDMFKQPCGWAEPNLCTDCAAPGGRGWSSPA
jgi:hypothetical protein